MCDNSLWVQKNCAMGNTGEGLAVLRAYQPDTVDWYSFWGKYIYLGSSNVKYCDWPHIWRMSQQWLGPLSDTLSKWKQVCFCSVLKVYFIWATRKSVACHNTLHKSTGQISYDPLAVKVVLISGCLLQMFLFQKHQVDCLDGHIAQGTSRLHRNFLS